MSNFFVQELVLYRHFMLIDSPIPFELVANPTNYRKDEHGNILNTDMSEITGRDICSRPAGAWRVDCWTLLPEKYHKQNPVFTMLIKYDKDLLDEGEIVDIRYSDIDIGEGVAGVNGQLVSIPASDFRPVVLAVNSVSDKIGSAANSVSDKIGSAVNSVSDKIGSIDNGTVLDVLSEILSFFPRSRVFGGANFQSFLTSFSMGQHRLFFGSIVASGSNGELVLNGLFDAFMDTDDPMLKSWVGVSLFCKGYFHNKSSGDHVIICGKVEIDFDVQHQRYNTDIYVDCENTTSKSLTVSHFSIVDLFLLGD